MRLGGIGLEAQRHRRRFRTARYPRSRGIQIEKIEKIMRPRGIGEGEDEFRIA